MKKLIFIVVFFLVSVFSFGQTYSNVDSIEVNYITVYKSVCYEGDGCFGTFGANLKEPRTVGFVKFNFNEDMTKVKIDENTVINQLGKFAPYMISLGEYNVRNLPKVIIFYMENEYNVNVIIYKKETKSIWCGQLNK
jgi:hypothetical protein